MWTHCLGLLGHDESIKTMGGLGIRGMELFNIALLACQTRRVLHAPNSISLKISKAVYFPKTMIPDATVGSHPSGIWCLILEGCDVWIIGLIRKIDDGSSTEIWRQNWLPQGGSMRPINTSNGNISLVSELIDRNPCHGERIWCVTPFEY